MSFKQKALMMALAFSGIADAAMMDNVTLRRDMSKVHSPKTSVQLKVRKRNKIAKQSRKRNRKKKKF